MSDLFWLTDEQMERLRPFFPKSHGKPRVDDRRVLSGIVFVNRNGLRWRDAPAVYGPPKTLYNRWKRWGEAGVFTRMMEGLAAAYTESKTVMIDATSRGGLTTKLHAAVKAISLPIRIHPTTGQWGDRPQAEALLTGLEGVGHVIADAAYDADPLRAFIADDLGATAHIQANPSRTRTPPIDWRVYKERYQLEFFFNKLKRFRRIALRCAARKPSPPLRASSISNDGLRGCVHVSVRRAPIGYPH